MDLLVARRSRQSGRARTAWGLTQNLATLNTLFATPALPRWIIDHSDDYNPDYGHALEHLFTTTRWEGLQL